MITSCASPRVEFIPVFSHHNDWLMRWLHSLMSMLNLIFLLLLDGMRLLFPLWCLWCDCWSWLPLNEDINQSQLSVQFIPIFSHPNDRLMREFHISDQIACLHRLPPSWWHQTSLPLVMSIVWLLKFITPTALFSTFSTLWWVRLSCVLWMRNNLFLRPVWLSSSSSFSLMIFDFSLHVMSMVWLSELKTIEWRQWPITTKWLLLHFCRSASDDSRVTFSHNSQWSSVNLFYKHPFIHFNIFIFSDFNI